MDNFIKPFDKGVAARTNMLKVIENQESLIVKLITGNSEKKGINYSLKEVHKKTGEENSDYYRRIALEIKTAIRAQLGIKNNEPVNYDFLYNENKNQIMFFFIGESSCDADKLLNATQKYNFKLEKIVQTLFSLRLKLSYIGDVTSRYEIEPALFNADLYLGAIETGTIKEGGSLIEALRLNLYFSKQNEITLSLHKKAFHCVPEENFMPDELFFHHKSKELRVQETMDAITYAKRPYMEYSLSEKYKDDPKYANKGYQNCINYHLTVSLNKLIKILSDADINFKPIEFKANYIISDFIESSESYNNPLIIIDTFSSYKTEEWKKQFREHLKQMFGAKCVIDVEDAPKPEQLETDGTNYLVVNEEKKRNGSSIIRMDTGKPLNSFFQALELKNKDNINFDYYTEVKIHRFKNNLSSVTQGLNIENVTSSKALKDENGNKLPSITVLKKIDKNKIQKIKTELWLKEQVFHHNSVVGINFPESKLMLFFVRKFKNKKTYISVVDITTSDNGIKINNHKRYENIDESRFNLTYHYLKSAFPPSTSSCFEAMYNQGFYLYDKTHKKLLVSYSSDGIPNIIGNAAIDNVERSKQINGINRKNPPENCVLPYYINPKRKQFYHVFLEDYKQEGLRYFVMSKSNSPDATIAKQYRMQNILVFNKDGSKAFPIKEELTSLFLQSFTFDMLNNKEVSKKSILQKVAELYIEN